jgi:hypothetical protein
MPRPPPSKTGDSVSPESWSSVFGKDLAEDSADFVNIALLSDQSGGADAGIAGELDMQAALEQPLGGIVAAKAGPLRRRQIDADRIP